MNYLIYINKLSEAVLADKENPTDESKQVQFKDKVEAILTLLESLGMEYRSFDMAHGIIAWLKENIGKTFPLPEGVSVRFKVECLKECMGMCGECNHMEKVAIFDQEPKVEEQLKEKHDYEDLAKTLHGRIRATDQEYIICAAIHFDDYLKHQHQPKNIETGLVVCGRRHHNCFVTVSAMSQTLDYRNYKSKEKEQGFLTSKDRFVDRKEAGEIAFKAGQTKELRTCLFSEDLY